MKTCLRSAGDFSKFTRQTALTSTILEARWLWFEQIFQEFIDAIQTDRKRYGRLRTSRNAIRPEARLSEFAYLRLNGDTPTLISSYPKSWTNRNFQLRYQQLDPIVLRARVEHTLFNWGGDLRTPAENRLSAIMRTAFTVLDASLRLDRSQEEAQPHHRVGTRNGDYE